MNQKVNDPFGDIAEEEIQNQEGQDMQSAQSGISTEITAVDYKTESTKPYPYINADGEIKVGVAITLSEDNSDALFGNSDESQTFMALFNSETQERIKTNLEFAPESLNKKMKSIPAEAFENLSNVKKTVTLSKAYKNQLPASVTKLSQLAIDQTEMTIVMREVKKNATLSKDLLTKINESTGQGLEGMLESYVFEKHLLITGDAGQGKTYIVDKFINDNGFTMVQENGHTGLEAIDLIGHMIKLQDGSFGWKDGSLSQAFRMAEKGEKVVYFMDEMLRIPERELNIFVSSLTPNSRGELKLRTSRPLNGLVDGIVNGEEITIKMENFWVVATTNQGAGYQSSRIEEALKDRFRLFYQEMSEDDTLEIITNKMSRHGNSAIAVKSLVSLISKTKEIQATGNIPRNFTIRHLSEAVDTAKSMKDIKNKMIELSNNIVSIDSDGRFNASQINIVVQLIKKTL